jgi:BASS family bile acid:Na+ symporter
LITVVLVSVVVPLCLGIVVRAIAPAVAEAVSRPLALLATILLVLTALPIAYVTGAAVWQLVGDGVVVLLVLFAVLGLAAGHFLGGPDEDDRTVLALATATRHPAIAMAIASVNFPDEKATLAVVLWHLLFSIIISVPYVRWRKRVHQTVSGKANDGHS